MTPASILSVSKDFHRGFELCYGNGLRASNGVRNATVPAVVCLALSVELGFKAILAGLNKPSEGHKFVELFSKLSSDIKADIQHLVVGDENEFSSRLESVSNAFVEWRYIFEENGCHSIDLDFLVKLHSAVNQIGIRFVNEQRAKLLADKS